MKKVVININIDELVLDSGVITDKPNANHIGETVQTELASLLQQSQNAGGFLMNDKNNNNISSQDNEISSLDGGTLVLPPRGSANSALLGTKIARSIYRVLGGIETK